MQLDDESDCGGSELPPKLVSVGLSANTGNEAALGIGLVGEEIQPSGKNRLLDDQESGSWAEAEAGVIGDSVKPTSSILDVSNQYSSLS